MRWEEWIESINEEIGKDVREMNEKYKYINIIIPYSLLHIKLILFYYSYSSKHKL